MKASELSKNISVDAKFDVPDIVWFDVKDAPFVVSGVYYDQEQKCYTRMPDSIAKNVSPNVRGLVHDTAGGRVRFRTDSTFIGMYAIMSDGTRTVEPSHSCFDIQRRNPDFEYLKQDTFLYSFIPPLTIHKGFSAQVTTDGYMEDYTLHMPTQSPVKELYIAVKADAELLEPTPYKHPKPIVYYGSSITQGAGSSRPANTYQAIISKHLSTEYYNLGFGGSAMGEQAMADYIAGLDMSIFVCDYDHNASGAEHLMATHLPFYRTVRNAHPDLPIVFITAPNTMPWYTWYQPRRDAIYNTYKTAIAEGDKNVYFIDGDTLFGDIDKDLCTVDTCHPSDLGIYRMALTIEEVLSKILNK